MVPARQKPEEGNDGRAKAGVTRGCKPGWLESRAGLGRAAGRTGGSPRLPGVGQDCVH